MKSLAHRPRSAAVPGAPAPSARVVLRRACACGGTPGPAGECEACRRKRLQRSAASAAAAPAVAPPIVHDVLRAPGRPLDRATRREMEPHFGHSFADVRVHADGRAAESARAVDAAAYTVGRDVVFGAGQYAPGTQAGRALLAHELAHVVQQAGTGPVPARLEVGRVDDPAEREAAAAEPRTAERAPVLRRICFRGGVTAPPPGACAPVLPEACPTYGQWVASFEGMETFTARDTVPGGVETSDQDVLGAAPASPDPAAPAGKRPAPFVRPAGTDRFIDHPTDKWVQQCLPPNLRETAYRLPSDCADIAVILRHVWLSAHRRTETFSGWTVGDRAGGARQADVGRIIGSVYTGNVQRMLNPYTDAAGRPLRSFAELENLLHPGDVLVWEHHRGGLGTARTGGHTHTIVSIARDPATGRITSIGALQGNQPIGQEAADEIRADVGRGAPSAAALRDAPGRRVEADTLSGGSLRDLTLPPRRGSTTPGPTVWTWSNGHTTLVAAGPPAAAPRPAMRTIARRRVRRLSDWHAPLRAAPAERLQGTLEAALQEMRANIEGGQAVPTTDARELGEAAGERLWSLARRAADLAEESHFRPLERIRGVIGALGAAPSTRAAAVSAAFGETDDAFNLAARGATTIAFPTRARRGTTLLRMLVTGFDPFNMADSTQPPRRGEWNPSGAAALALDGTTVTGPGRARTAVEGVVLPVSFPEFAGGLVERIVGPHAAAVDAVITVSLDPGIGPTAPVRLERYAVGVHQLLNGTLQPVAAAPGGTRGAAIVESRGPIDDIAADTEQAPRGRSPGVPRPVTGENVTFRFATAARADAALTALGLSAAGTAEVEISDRTALRQIIQTMQRSTDGLSIDFTAGGGTHRARVLSGPGGDFLSNEVSYRVLRLLGTTSSPLDPTSFHVHTQAGTVIPQDTSTRTARTARRTALDVARGIRTRLITTLQRVIRATAGRIMARRTTP